MDKTFFSSNTLLCSKRIHVSNSSRNVFPRAPYRPTRGLVRATSERPTLDVESKSNKKSVFGRALRAHAGDRLHMFTAGLHKFYSSLHT
eukprot:816236-Prorocentrum_minimum.AAC.3